MEAVVNGYKIWRKRMKAVKWGILGVSKHFLTRVMTPMMKTASSDVYAIASRSGDKAQVAAEKHGIPVAYSSYEELLTDKNIEAVYIPLPNHLHLEWIRHAADAGKHILCEKPLTLNEEQTREAIDYCAAKDVLLMEAFMYRFHPQWQKAKELAHTGVLGKITAVQTYFGYNNPDPSNIRNKLDMGGGAIYDIGCYAVSAARHMFGSEPERVLSSIRRDKEFGTDMLTSSILDFGSGQSTFTITTRAFPCQKVDIIGTSGRIHIHVPFNVADDVPASITVVNSVGEREVLFDPIDQYGLQADAFSTAVRTGGDAPIPLSDALGNSRTLDALFRSEQSGGWESIV